MKSLNTFGKYSLGQSKVKMILGMAIGLLLLSTLANCQRTYYQIPLRTRSARTLYPVALKKARGWRPDAYLASITVDVLPRDDYTQRVRLSFDFQSPSDDRYSLSVSFQGDSDEVEIEQFSHETGVPVQDPINSEGWPLDSVDVLPIAQANGGNEFLAGRNLEVMLMSLYLERRPFVPGAPLRWRALYFNIVTGDSLDVMVDPQAGKVISIEKSPSR